MTLKHFRFHLVALTPGTKVEEGECFLRMEATSQKAAISAFNKHVGGLRENVFEGYNGTVDIVMRCVTKIREQDPTIPAGMEKDDGEEPQCNMGLVSS